MPNFWRVVNRVIQEAEVLLILLDARMVIESRNKEIEDKVKKLEKPLIYVITKADLVEDKKEVEKYKKEFQPCVFVSTIKYHGTTILREKILIEAKRHNIETVPINVGVLGYPNVGKSSLINAMSGRGTASTSMMSGHTKGVQKIKGDNRIMFLDTPGVIPYKEKESQKHSVIGSVDFTKVKDPDMAVMSLMEQFPGKVEEYYKVKVRKNFEAVIEEIAIKRSIVKKGNIPDIDRVSRTILKDWQTGRITQQPDLGPGWIFKAPK